MATYMNMATGGRYTFVAPAVDVDGTKETKVQFPVTDYQEVTISEENTATATISQTTTILDLGSTALAAKPTITLTNKCPEGARIILKFTCTSKYDVDLSDGTNTVTITGTANTTTTSELFFIGGIWYKIK